MISKEQRKECVRLYQSGYYPIKQIMRITGIRSEQTIYRILDEQGVSRKDKRETHYRATISFDRDSWNIIEKACPYNLSEWVCGLIKKSSVQKCSK